MHYKTSGNRVKSVSENKIKGIHSCCNPWDTPFTKQYLRNLSWATKDTFNFLDEWIDLMPFSMKDIEICIKVDSDAAINVEGGIGIQEIEFQT